MGRNVVVAEARINDARYLASLDIIGHEDKVGFREERTAYWSERLALLPGPVYIAKIDGAMAAGYLALNGSEEAPLAPDLFVSPRCLEDGVADALLRRAGIEQIPVHED